MAIVKVQQGVALFNGKQVTSKDPAFRVSGNDPQLDWPKILTAADIAAFADNPWFGKAGSYDALVEVKAEKTKVQLLVIGEYGTPSDDPDFPLPHGEIELYPGQSFTCPMTDMHQKTVVIVSG